MRTWFVLAVLLIVGLLLGASMLVYAAYVLLAVFWFCRFLTKEWMDGLKATRTMSLTEVEIGQKVSIQLQVANRGKWSIAWLLLDDALPRQALFDPPPALKREGSSLRMCWIPARGTRVLSYVLIPLRRGFYQIGPLVAETGDLLGLHRRFKSITEPEFLLVKPKVIPLEGYNVASRRPIGEVRVTYRFMEDPTLISGTRLYQNGDPMRNIHWRASARTGQLQCKQYQPTCVAGATLVLDMHRNSNPTKHEPVRGDLAATAAASICHTLMQLGQQFGMVSNGRDAADRMATERRLREFHDRDEAQQAVAMHSSSDRMRPVIVPTGRGPGQFEDVLKALARLERTDGLSLSELLLEAQSRLPRDATVMVIVQEVDDAAALALGMLRRQGYSVAAIVNNYDNESFTAAVGRLLAQRIAVYHLLDEDSISRICKELVLRY